MHKRHVYLVLYMQTFTQEGAPRAGVWDEALDVAVVVRNVLDVKEQLLGPKSWVCHSQKESAERKCKLRESNRAGLLD